MLKCCLKIGSAASSPSSSLSKQLFKLFFKPIILILTSAETRLTGVTHTSVRISFYVLVMLCCAFIFSSYYCYNHNYHKLVTMFENACPGARSALSV